jgi:hypothetical protein
LLRNCPPSSLCGLLQPFFTPLLSNILDRLQRAYQAMAEGRIVETGKSLDRGIRRRCPRSEIVWWKSKLALMLQLAARWKQGIVGSKWKVLGVDALLQPFST